MSNYAGKTGKRSVKYIRPGLTQVIYEDRVLDIRTKETNEEFASKVKARTDKVPEGYKTKQEAYNARRARNKAARTTSKPKKMNALEEGLASGKYVLE